MSPEPETIRQTVHGDVLASDESAAEKGLSTLTPFRCPNCHALLFKGELKGEIKCRVCNKYLIVGL